MRPVGIPGTAGRIRLDLSACVLRALGLGRPRAELWCRDQPHGLLSPPFGGEKQLVGGHHAWTRRPHLDDDEGEGLHLLDNAEDPAETLDYAYNQQLEDLQKVKSGIADVVTAKKRLQLQEEQLHQQADKLDSQAKQAMSAGREDLSRAAIERKQLIISEVTSLDQQVADLEAQQQKLTDAERNLQTKIEEFRTKKEVIKAQYSASEAQVRISEAATGIGDHMADLGEAMQRAIDKTDDMQARASAVEELQAAGTFEDLTSLGPAAGRRRPPTGSAGRQERGRR